MTDEPGKDALNGLTDQVRTVHFTLVLVAFVLLATSLQEPKRKIERSISDARSIYTLASALFPFGGPISEEVGGAAAKYRAEYAGNLQKESEINVEIRWPGGPQTVNLYSETLKWAYISDRQYEGEDDIHQPAYAYVPFQVRSLADFISFWDHNLSDQVVVTPRIEPKDIHSTRPVTYQEKFRFLPPNIRPTSMLLLHAGVEGDSLNFYTYPDFSRGEPALTISVPITKIPSLNIQVLLIRFAKKEADWLPGKFETSFPELSDRAKNLTTLDLRDLITELNDQANREQDKIELLGAKLDPAIVTRWGLLILAMCQFYLWLHLTALRQTVATTTDAYVLGWIGLYPGFWARTFTVASLLAPSVIAVYWLIQQWGVLGLRSQLIVCLNTIICLVLGILSVRTLLRVRGRIGAAR